MEPKNWKQPTFKGFYKFIEAAEKIRDAIIAIENRKIENLKNIMEMKRDAMGATECQRSSSTGSK